MAEGEERVSCWVSAGVEIAIAVRSASWVSETVDELSEREV